MSPSVTDFETSCTYVVPSLRENHQIWRSIRDWRFFILLASGDDEPYFCYWNPREKEKNNAEDFQARLEFPGTIHLAIWRSDVASFPVFHALTQLLFSCLWSNKSPCLLKDSATPSTGHPSMLRFNRSKLVKPPAPRAFLLLSMMCAKELGVKNQQHRFHQHHRRTEVTSVPRGHVPMMIALLLPFDLVTHTLRKKKDDDEYMTHQTSTTHSWTKHKRSKRKVHVHRNLSYIYT